MKRYFYGVAVPLARVLPEENPGPTLILRFRSADVRNRWVERANSLGPTSPYFSMQASSSNREVRWANRSRVPGWFPGAYGDGRGEFQLHWRKS
jgi:hypothetical protein